MQTFLPYPSYRESAKVLDRQRLGKQRVEVIQILNTIGRGSGGWSNHPAVKMWRGHEQELANYGVAICEEWTSRGYRDTCREKIIGLTENYKSTSAPEWVGDEKFHASHRSNLLRKNVTHYSQFGWKESSDLPYIWPKE
jgi:hypothetical protein